MTRTVNDACKNVSWGIVTTWALRVAWAIVAALVLFMLDKGYARVEDLSESHADLRTTVAVIQGNRFTSEDGMEVWKKFSTVDTHLARHEAILERLTKSDTRLDNVEKQLIQLNKQLAINTTLLQEMMKREEKQ